MFTCYTKQDRFETYVITNEDHTIYIEIVPERGGIVSKYMYHNEPVFYLEQDTLEDISKNIRGGNPILFPISSYLVDETYYYNDTAYQLKQHGFARNLPGKVVHTFADEHSASISLEMVDNEETYERYPFHFKLVMQYTLTKNGLNIQATIHNNDNKVMPFYLGYHPYFYVEDKEQLQINIPSTNYTQLVPNSVVQDKLNFDQPESTVIYEQLQSNHCEMIDHARQRKVTITSEEVYRYMVLWTLQEKPFVCIEPWMAPVNGMNIGQGIQLLEANQTHTSTIQITAESLI